MDVLSLLSIPVSRGHEICPGREPERDKADYGRTFIRDCAPELNVRRRTLAPLSPRHVQADSHLHRLGYPST
jgi:hypothetical protein